MKKSIIIALALALVLFAGLLVGCGDNSGKSSNKGGSINMFEDFDIDYNQQKYLIETRMSGALIKPFSAIVLELNKAS